MIVRGTLLPSLVACVALAACGAGSPERSSSEIPPTTTPLPAVTTPSEGGEVVETPVTTPERSKTTEKTAAAPEKSGAAPGQQAADAPATAPNSRGPYGPPEVKAPKAGRSSPERARITTRVSTFLRAIAASNGKRACDQMTAAGQRAMAKKIAAIAPETQGAACKEAIVLYQGAYGDTIKNPKITGVRVSGNAATAVGPLKQVARLERRGGRWLIAEYGQ